MNSYVQIKVLMAMCNMDGCIYTCVLVETSMICPEYIPVISPLFSVIQMHTEAALNLC